MALRDKRHGTEEKVLDVDASMQGSLCFKDPVNLRINGKFEGVLETRGSLTISDTASVNARIIGDSITISGHVKGEILAKEKITLLAPALVEGTIKTPKLSISEGAKFEGNCHMLEDILSVEDLARYLEVDINSVVDWANSGKVPAYKDGERWKFERTKIDEWVASGAIK
ncbi:MAG: polymer-forming cytoskeletal protein [Candidatus Omnitrophota bacterium]|nr:polymer-forming cytoskeletal protein [Candidatus Omnitrophota bacterium]